VDLWLMDIYILVLSCVWKAGTYKVGPTYYEETNNDTMDYPQFKIFVRLSIAFRNEWGTRILNLWFMLLSRI